jgi:hypothetical protein
MKRPFSSNSWSWRWDSNPQPADYKSAALPIELRQRSLRLILPSVDHVKPTFSQDLFLYLISQTVSIFFSSCQRQLFWRRRSYPQTRWCRSVARPQATIGEIEKIYLLLRQLLLLHMKNLHRRCRRSSGYRWQSVFPAQGRPAS